MKSLVCVVVLVLFACSDPADKPIEPVWGKQPCEHCQMILSEPRFAAQLATSDGMHRYFDDIGCMLAWLHEQHQPAARLWVRSGTRWIAARDARYRLGERTPMDYGAVVADEGVGFSDVERGIAPRLVEDEHAR